MKKKILICEYSQESNSFSPLIWDVDRFQSMACCGGAKMKLIFSVIKSPVKGMADVVKKYGGKAVYGYAMRAMSGGPVSDRSVEFFLDKVFRLLDKKGPFDGILLSLHGATISESEEDACGYILEKLRKKAGDTCLIGISCDMHANITRRMEKCADYISGFRTYPHVDFYDTGYRAGEMVMKRLSGEKLKQMFFRMPMMVPASGYTSRERSFKGIMARAAQRAAEINAADHSVFMMQPWLDVREAASCVTYAAENEAAAASAAEDIGRLIFESREEFWPHLSSVDEAIDKAVENRASRKPGPVVLAEPADSPNAGAVGDSVEILMRLMERGENIKAATVVMDIAAAEKARREGVGSTALYRLGASCTPKMPGPAELNCKVISVHKGKFRMAGPAGKGLVMDIGKTAVLRSGNTDILVCERPGGTGDLNFYRGFGIEPTEYDLIVVKANTSFREVYTPIAADIFIADTYGAAAADFTVLPFNRLDKGNFYPFNKNPKLP